MAHGGGLEGPSLCYLLLPTLVLLIAQKPLPYALAAPLARLLNDCSAYFMEEELLREWLMVE
ncbi:MAG: hypothetical protein AUG51_16675 [Acidobacteria bacterium 13_1_20CM_3_53_8]|nr:MAG: hypothetical protein AUG51_16675 [Acidobacteria bacterium 13_1_20CM_3_53_8]